MSEPISYCRHCGYEWHPEPDPAHCPRCDFPTSDAPPALHPSRMTLLDITLRDYFAGQALAGYVAVGDNEVCPNAIHTQGPTAIEQWRNETRLADARWVWKMADAMLATRSEQPTKD